MSTTSSKAGCARERSDARLQRDTSPVQLRDSPEPYLSRALLTGTRPHPTQRGDWRSVTGTVNPSATVRFRLPNGTARVGRRRTNVQLQPGPPWRSRLGVLVNRYGMYDGHWDGSDQGAWGLLHRLLTSA
jgi:hypothetical protein